MPIFILCKNKFLPGYHVPAGVGELDIRNGGDNFREKGPEHKNKMG